MTIPHISRGMLYFLLASLYLAGIGFLDCDYFFPSRAQSDFGFQVIGEALELLAMASSFRALFWTAHKFRQASALGQQVIALRFLAGLLLTVVFLAQSWRDFFPGDKFRYASGAHHIIAALIGGAFFGISYPLAFNQANGSRPVEPEETLVV
jgi:hypothetical protein